MTHHWHVAFTDSRAEQDTCAEIRDIGFDAFTPMERHKRFRHGRKTIVETALFPRYLFARFDSDDPHWAAILDIDGVCDVLSNQGQPSPLPEQIVPKLKRMEQNGLFDFTQAPNPFPPGTLARTDDDGPFADLLVRIKRVRTSDRLDVLLTYLGREMTVNISMARLSHI